MTIKGIDISHWNRVRDFNMVKYSGIDFVIIKAGGSDKGFYQDRYFNDYYRLAKLAGLQVGAYYFVGPRFISYEDGVADAQRFLRILNGRSLDYPACLDLESTGPKDKTGVTEASIAFMETVKKGGYLPMIYASDVSGFSERLNLSDLKSYDKWVARYGKKPQIVKDVKIWQKSSTGSVPGIEGNVDLDISYFDYGGMENGIS